MTPGAALPKKLQDSWTLSVVLPLWIPSFWGLCRKLSSLSVQIESMTRKLIFLRRAAIRAEQNESMT